mmetsp:Transcript_26683/g.61404  ORF Transcript_26683/g.61404 Transcript_26683/m.61404 type:complete len:91 (-) Transcript_26683:211-483(-)
MNRIRVSCLRRKALAKDAEEEDSPPPRHGAISGSGRLHGRIATSARASEVAKDDASRKVASPRDDAMTRTGSQPSASSSGTSCQGKGSES